MIDLKDFNHAHDGFIKQIDFDYDYSNFNRKQEIRIIYAVSVDEKQPDGNFKKLGYDYFQMIFNNPSSQHEPVFNINNCTFIYEIIQLESPIEDYCYWQIRMCKKDQYIDIYAKDLRIEKINNPFAN